MPSHDQASWLVVKILVFICLCLFVQLWDRENILDILNSSPDVRILSRQMQQSLAKCRNLKRKPGFAPDFHERIVSDRFEAGTPSTLIKNATIFTGSRNGTEVVYGGMSTNRCVEEVFNTEL
jgi:hypothetical protein